MNIGSLILAYECDSWLAKQYKVKRMNHVTSGFVYATRVGICDDSERS